MRMHLGDKVYRVYFFAVSYFVRVDKKYHDLLQYRGLFFAVFITFLVLLYNRLYLSSACAQNFIIDFLENETSYIKIFILYFI